MRQPSRAAAASPLDWIACCLRELRLRSIYMDASMPPLTRTVAACLASGQVLPLDLSGGRPAGHVPVLYDGAPPQAAFGAP